MTNELPIAHGQGTRTGAPTRHPAGDIRLPAQSMVGRRAHLLAGLDTVAGDPYTLIDTSFSMSWA
jgi:hypothetical protein